MSDASTIAQLRKSGDLDEAAVLAKRLLADSSEDWYLQNAYGWVIHDKLKRAGTALKRDEISGSDAESILDEYVNEYFRLGQIRRPDLLHSLILQCVLKMGKSWPRFLGFARWWGPDNFREEDLQPYLTNDGKELPSLAQRFSYAVARALTIDQKAIAAEHIEWGEQFLEEALAEAPDDQWLQYYRSKLLLLRGDLSRAREVLLPVVKRQRTSAWAWSLLGETWESDSPEKAIICYQHAIALAQKPAQALNVRERLAHLLVRAARFPEAAVQVRAALDDRKMAAYKIPDRLIRLSESSWYTTHISVPAPVQEAELAGKATELLYGELQYRSGVLEHHNHQKRVSYVAFSPRDGVVLKHSVFREIRDMRVGAVIEVSIEDETMAPIRVVRSQRHEIPGFYEEFNGILERVAARDFGFVRTTKSLDIFVPPGVMPNGSSSDGMQVRCAAVLSHDRKKGVDGWKALAIRIA